MTPVTVASEKCAVAEPHREHRGSAGLLRCIWIRVVLGDTQVLYPTL